MNKQTILTADEVFACISALETLMESDNANVAGIYIDPDVKQTLCQSAIKKLEAYHPLTYFSKKDYTMISFALAYISDISISANISDEFLLDIYSASDKIYILAGEP